MRERLDLHLLLYHGSVCQVAFQMAGSIYLLLVIYKNAISPKLFLTLDIKFLTI